MRTRKKIVMAIAVAAIAASVSGCMDVVIEGDQPSCVTPGAIKMKEKDLQGEQTIYWNFYTNKAWNDWKDVKASEGRGILQATYHTDMLCSLASVCSLGFCVPMHVSWKLQDLFPDDSKVKPWTPPGKQEASKSEEKEK